MKKLTSGTYDESTAMSDKFILQGNEDGMIKISSYSWVYNPQCENISRSPFKSQNTKENGLRKMASTSSKCF
jgi:hypothetical protein